MINIAIKPSAIGRLNLSSGIFGPCTPFDPAGCFVEVKLLPHTRQRAEFSGILDPQVGQVFVGFVFVSGLINSFFLE